MYVPNVLYLVGEVGLHHPSKIRAALDHILALTYQLFFCFTFEEIVNPGTTGFIGCLNDLKIRVPWNFHVRPMKASRFGWRAYDALD